MKYFDQENDYFNYNQRQAFLNPPVRTLDEDQILAFNQELGI